jgi:hypothetical protein
LEAKLYRLTIALSLLAFIGFGIPAAVQFEHSYSYGLLLKTDWELEQARIQKCKQAPEDCDHGSFDPFIKEWAIKRERAGQMSSTYLACAIFIPLGLFGLFFGSRWVRTGSFKSSEKTKEN